MHHLSVTSIFVRQNVWIKCFILLLGSIASLVVPYKALLYLLVITLFYMVLTPAIYRDIFKGLKLFLPFFAIYSLFSTLLDVPFLTMIFFMVRMCNLIILMAYFSGSLYIARLIDDSTLLLKRPITKSLIFFLVATILFINNLIKHYKSISANNHKKFMDYSKVIPYLIDAIAVNWQDRDNIEKESLVIINKPYAQVNFINKSNLLGCIYITALILLLSL